MWASKHTCVIKQRRARGVYHTKQGVANFSSKIEIDTPPPQIVILFIRISKKVIYPAINPPHKKAYCIDIVRVK